MSEIDETTPLAPNPTANSIPPQIAVTMAGAGPGPEPSITQTKPVIIHNFPQANPIPVQFGPNPISLVCGNCGASVLTNCIKTHSSKTTTWFWICCLIGCCCMPKCLNWYPQYVHKCPQCGIKLGVYMNDK